jgi:hypothetical protein
MRKLGQVWIETVLYTVIGLVLIGIALGFMYPKINAQKDRATVEQTMSLMDEMDNQVNSVLIAAGNVRINDFSVKRGTFIVDSTENELRFVIDDLSKPYSEVGQEINRGRIIVKTTENQKRYTVTLRLPFSGVADLKYEGAENKKDYTKASLPYKIAIESIQGTAGSGVYVVNIKDLSGA